ncbi:uncharacterized protein SPAPADRAFT_63259 [Spathaspora passalidarum NRRL Y-27907]|uniref:Uncharacterized protein n=1 Tax=Spathaspora passalidarum (strain NRRL Y-27907 / 11-Y1) TaxID=619300 RepID=G3AU33_SPAPN|nr:uncharacterized protein SPAPADRAFT_63259 [Spathaspora passalidarum NRRL Y-27907]EGW30409.1 hypothetical protein SPAPADRAFT_63259 [Spathaspora passalidarum NRRL Y-27907]
MSQITNESHYKPEEPPQYSPDSESDQESQISNLQRQSGNDNQCSTVCTDLCCGGCFGCCSEQTCMRSDKDMFGSILAVLCCGTAAGLAVPT